jgi:hypothetical protein
MGFSADVNCVNYGRNEIGREIIHAENTLERPLSWR